MKKHRIRPLALALIVDRGRVLVSEGRDPVKRETFYRLLGGGIEFGETGKEAVARELREEIGAELTDVRYVGTLENLFTYVGEPGHEICLIYEARLKDRAMYDRVSMEGLDADEPLLAVWKQVSDFRPGAPPLYPDGVVGLIPRPGKSPDLR